MSFAADSTISLNLSDSGRNQRSSRLQSTGESSFLVIDHIHKTYSSNGVHACNDIQLTIEQGSSHVIVGENGAGKSTIMKILSGDIEPDSGRIIYKGREVSFHTPEDALEQGIGMIHQILHFFPELTVREHLILGMRSVSSWRPIQQQEIDAHIQSICDRYDITCDPNELVEHLGAEARQITALMALIHRETEVFILDEPPPALLSVARRLQKEGKTIIIITHNMRDALKYGDHITVLRGGCKQGTFPAKDLTIGMLTRLIMGEDNTSTIPRDGKDRRAPSRSRRGEPAISIRDLSGGQPDTMDMVHDISLQVFPGETLAVVGIHENGLRALEALVTAWRSARYIRTGGSVHILGKPPSRCSHKEVGYIPSDRLELGSSVTMNVTENLLIHDRRDTDLLMHLPLFKSRQAALPVYSAGTLNRLVHSVIESYAIKGEPNHPLMSLSGGNIQKLITARALFHSPKVLICADISWGLDVRTRKTLFDAIEVLKAEGMAVLFFTSEVDTALDEADRIAVLRRGHLADVIANTPALSAAEIGALML